MRRIIDWVPIFGAFTIDTDDSKIVVKLIYQSICIGIVLSLSFYLKSK